jgi:2-polyprenyl-3-methyl-5-hydroxy-6-metoxy-1,4-benzoquinol methylase
MMINATHHPSKPCPLCGNAAIRPYRSLTRAYGNEVYPLSLVQCGQCHFVYLANDLQISYDEEYLYNEQVVTSEDMLAAFRARERVAGIAHVVAPQPGRSFLDIGIGDGLLLSVAEQAGYTTFGLDVNAAGVAMARERYGVKADIRIQPPEEAFPDQQFDVIHMNEVIEHIPEPLSMLQWCRRHLRVGGYLVIQTGNVDSLASRMKGADWDYFRPVHVSYFSTRTLAYAGRKAGFTVSRYATTDWRLAPVVATARTVSKADGALRGLRLVALYLTAKLYGVRRTVLMYFT